MKSKLLIFLTLLSFNFINAQNIDLEKGLRVYYPFNGDANDESSNENNGEVKGAKLTIDRHGIENSAFEFDGVDDYIDIGSDKSLKPNFPFSFSCWFSFNKIEQNFAIIFSNDRFSGSSGNRYGFVLQYFSPPKFKNTRFYAAVGNGKSSGAGSSSRVGLDIPIEIIPKNWYHIVVNYQSVRDCQIFINGELTEGNFGGHGKSLQYSDNRGRIGHGIGSGTPHFNGKIDDIRLYDRILTECEIKVLMELKHSKKVVLDYISINMEKWNKKDEYETTSEYELRIKNKSSKKEEKLHKYVLDSLVNNISWNCATKEYNADYETFKLQFPNLEPFNLKVPRSEARLFGDNFDKLEYSDTQLVVTERPNLVVKCITIRNPVNGKLYRYGCQTNK